MGGGLEVCYMSRRVPFILHVPLFCVCLYVCICMYMCAHIMYMCVFVCLDVMLIVECGVCGEEYDCV